ncbi:MAG TPA: hypothetical protein VHM70_32775 [Polyangiaceae bacterium]|jgi:hypothetical protein|nr:hypothetical protein [Polyangiaceae bacterium]
MSRSMTGKVLAQLGLVAASVVGSCAQREGAPASTSSSASGSNPQAPPLAAPSPSSSSSSNADEPITITRGLALELLPLLRDCLAHPEAHGAQLSEEQSRLLPRTADDPSEAKDNQLRLGVWWLHAYDGKVVASSTPIEWRMQHWRAWFDVYFEHTASGWRVAPGCVSVVLAETTRTSQTNSTSD